MTRKRIAIIAAAVIMAAVVLLSAFSWGRTKYLEGSGTVEARDIRVGSKVGGRVTQVLAREGDHVKAGQVLVTFDEEELLGALEQARGREAQARAQYEMMTRGYRSEDVAEAQAAAAQAQAGLQEARTGYRREQVLQAQADLERARADAANAERTFQRMQQLAKDGVISRQQHDDAEAAARMAQAQFRAAQERAAEFERGYRSEDVAAAEARYRQAHAGATKAKRGYRPEEVAGAKAQWENEQGVLREAEARYRERQVVAPADCTVEVLDVRPGDLIAPNVPIATLLERDQVYIRIFLPETKVGLVRVGQTAEVRVDSFPNKVFPAHVEQVNQKAEFLPRNVQTRAEREHQVIGVKLRIDDPEALVRAGVAADVRLKLEK